ncbi:MAG: DUF2953 domain-containing protein [Faecalibacterium sp.]|nr:DUF2953 domain-containing protein [Faecalibacterium sp.]
MAALMLLVRVLLWLLAAVLVILLVLLFVPVSVWLEYADGVFRVRMGMLFVKIPVWPQKPLTEEQKQKKEAQKARRAAKKAKKEAKKKEKQPPADPNKPAPKKKFKLTLEMLCVLVNSAGTLLTKLLGALRITHIRIRYPVSGSDAAAVAESYGKTQAWLHTALGFLNRVFWLEFDEVYLTPDFTGNLAGTEHFSCKISARLIIMVIAGVAFVYTLYKEKVLDLFLK